jgi:hypothetical protein
MIKWLDQFCPIHNISKILCQGESEFAPPSLLIFVFWGKGLIWARGRRRDSRKQIFPPL